MTEEQEGLLAKAERSIRSAKLLVRDGDYDTAVSRAYYAMFYVAEALLLARDLAYSKHAAVIAGFGREFIKTGLLPSRHHADLRAAAEARNTADYEYASHLTEADTDQHIAGAELLLKVGKDFLHTQ